MTYIAYVKLNFMPILISRAIPVAGITLLLALVAHKSSADLAVFSYTLAIFTIISALGCMCMSAMGNIAARPKTDDGTAQQVFSSGLYLSAAIAGLVAVLSLVVASSIAALPGVQNLPAGKLNTLAMIYITSAPVVVVNTFLHLFNEGSGYAAECSTIKTGATTIGCVFLGLSYATVGPSLFIFLAMGYFLVTELITLFAFARLSSHRTFNFRFGFCRATASKALTLGLPIAIGLGGQKLYFYLLNEHLAAIDEVLLGQLAVFMTVTGLLLIPYISLGQTHSLYISRTPQHRVRAYLAGLGGLCLLTMLLVSVGLLLGTTLLNLLGGSILPATPAVFRALLLFLLSHGLLSLTMGHLRGINDTLKPQLIVNLIIFTALVPTLYLVVPEVLDLIWYMTIQSLATLCIWAVLTIRIIVLHHQQANPGGV